MELPDFNKLWDFAHPDQTEKSFRELLPAAEEFGDRSYLAQLLTQIARTQGLQGRFDEAHATLDRVVDLLTDDLKLARVRYLLERGRVFNSSDKPRQAMPLFEQAYELAEAETQMRYAIDAVHMLAIAEIDPVKQIEWNLKGIAMAQANDGQRGWLWSLYNNIAESYAALRDYQPALDYVMKLIEFQKERGEPDMYTLKDQARFLRLLGRPAESLAIIEPIYHSLADQNKDDGWIREELGEALYALGRHGDARPHLAKAYELLSKDPWCIRKEPEKLRRLAELGVCKS